MKEVVAPVSIRIFIGLWLTIVVMKMRNDFDGFVILIAEAAPSFADSGIINLEAAAVNDRVEDLVQGCGWLIVVANQAVVGFVVDT